MKLREGKVKAQAARYRLDDLLIDTGSRRVTRGGVDLGITGLSFDLLIAMCRVAPNLLSMDALIDSVWAGQMVSSETVTQRVKLLRQLLGDHAASPRYVSSRRGYGYALISTPVPIAAESAQLSTDTRAQELYLQARVVMRGTHESRDQALVLLDQALSRDPQFARALAFRALLQAGSVALSGAPANLLDSAERDATRALALDPHLPDAHVARALVCSDRRHWLEAESHFGAALSEETADPFVRNMHVLNVLRPTGRLRQACAELAESYRLAPANGFTAHELALTHSLLGDDAEAVKFADLAQILSGISEPHWDVMLVHARAAARRGRFTDAAARATSALPSVLRDDGGPQIAGIFYSALADASQAGRAREALRAFMPRLEVVGIDGRTRLFFVTALAMIGDLDGAYDLMNRFLREPAAGAHLSVELSGLWLPEMLAFRADPRFHDLTQRLRLPDYWKRHGSPDV